MVEPGLIGWDMGRGKRTAAPAAGARRWTEARRSRAAERERVGVAPHEQ
jgi:hypothetical protein